MLDLRGERGPLRGIVPRAAMDVAEAADRIHPILEDVHKRGAAAVMQWSEQLDGIAPPSLRVPASEIERAVSQLDPGVRDALEEAIRRSRIVHGDQRRSDVTTQVVPGGTVTERWIPVERVGLYVPGGRAVYPT